MRSCRTKKCWKGGLAEQLREHERGSLPPDIPVTLFKVSTPPANISVSEITWPQTVWCNIKIMSPTFQYFIIFKLKYIALVSCFILGSVSNSTGGWPPGHAGSGCLLFWTMATCGHLPVEFWSLPWHICRVLCWVWYQLRSIAWTFPGERESDSRGLTTLLCYHTRSKINTKLTVYETTHCIG